MYLRYGFIADHITPGHANKKTVIGIFDLIVAPAFPTKHKTLSILVKVEGSRIEAGVHRLAIELIDGDAQSLGKSQEIQFELKVEGRAYPDAPLSWEFVMEIPDLVLPRAGTYEFTVKVDGRHLGSIPLYAIQARDAQLTH
jgi:hypothetical protein